MIDKLNSKILELTFQLSKLSEDNRTLKIGNDELVQNIKNLNNKQSEIVGNFDFDKSFVHIIKNIDRVVL